jgi:septal ring factor EnvC (AmiA/AmiB activator)
MINPASNLPPTELSDAAMKLASTLLQIAVDPNGTATRLAELAAATQTIRDAIASNETTAAKAAEVDAAQAAVTANDARRRSRLCRSRQANRGAAAIGTTNAR